ncbi:hypothetical protein DFJ58DRAFT_828355, partial [Suillus subalutaceus]|uniref:uncharacterized protein n=1 Tax=Suillus subalutaceus TaxID=48586 RepID=UPI001B8617F0
MTVVLWLSLACFTNHCHQFNAIPSFQFLVPHPLFPSHFIHFHNHDFHIRPRQVQNVKFSNGFDDCEILGAISRLSLDTLLSLSCFTELS